MHSILALAASHLDKLARCGLTAVAQSHRLLAIKGLNKASGQSSQSAEDGDAVIAACNALLMQSWYMDDGLQSFLIMTRSCNLVTGQIQARKIGAILAYEDLGSRLHNVRARLEGASPFDAVFIHAATVSLDALRPLYRQDFEKDLLACLFNGFRSLSKTPTEGMIVSLLSPELYMYSR